VIPIRDHRPSGTFPVVTVGLIAVNVVVFLYEQLLMASGQLDPFLQRWAFIPAQLLSNPGGEFITVFTAMFLHGGWLHLIGNMLYLWIFGDNVEDTLGPVLYLIFYFGSGVFATFAQALAGPASTVPNLGASGAIAGVLGGYLALFPNARVDVILTLGWIWRRATVSALLVLGVWIGIQLLRGIFSLGQISGAAGGVAYFAHIGGFAAGLIAMYLYRGLRGVGVSRG
jgi:membrane associated rhomboid family serine protease